MPQETVVLITVDGTTVRVFSTFDGAVSYVRFVYQKFEMVDDGGKEDENGKTLKRRSYVNAERWIYVREINVDVRP